MTKLLVAIGLFCLPLVAFGGMWDKMKQGASEATETVGDAVSSGAEAVTDVAAPDRSHQEIDDMAASALHELFMANSVAEKLYGKSYGYAVFDSRKMSFMITTAFGSGVAVEKSTGKHS